MEEIEIGGQPPRSSQLLHQVRLQQEIMEDYKRLEQESLKAVCMCKFLMVICIAAVILYWVVLIVWAYWFFANQDQFVSEIIKLTQQPSAIAG
uniref:Hypothetical second orf within G protein n=1 Tax=Turkey rhinotracheitis virus TaxID=11264 RepID=Q90090_TRTV|nr:hypothetical second orf within G [Turkey rhinotracheitis virus]